jgi:hypothetical protein
MAHAAEVARHVTSLLDGSGVACGPDPGEWGRTTDEERRETARSAMSLGKQHMLFLTATRVGANGSFGPLSLSQT